VFGEFPDSTDRIGELAMKSNELNGVRIVYHDDTEFLVQVGKYKGSYKTKYRFIGNLVSAVLYLNGINISNGYKKRLIMPSAKKPVLARVFS
jgi:hypothetical protein